MRIYRYILAMGLAAMVASWATYRAVRRADAQAGAVEERPAVGKHPAPAVAPAAVAELARLAKENAEMRAALDEAKTRLTERDATLTQTREQLAELRRPMEADILSSALRAELKSGEVVVTGGYRLPDGKRVYAFAQPVVEKVDGVDRVKIQGRLLSLTEESGKAVGLDNLSTNAANTLQHGEVWVADEQQDVLGRLSSDATVDLLTMPNITLKSGGSGLIEVGEIKLRLTPTLVGDQGGMTMELRLEQPQLPAPALPAAPPAAPAEAGPAL